MPTTNLKSPYEQGLALLASGKPAEAAVQFHTAMVEQQKNRAIRPRMRVHSYYALSKALNDKLTREDLRLCEQAAARDHFDPILHMNLGRVYLRAGKIAKAMVAFQRGLRIDPSHAELRRLYNRTNRRSRPVIPLLGRDHPLNRLLGRLRAALTGSGSQ